jgi:Na+-driven multidrug efflux pump
MSTVAVVGNSVGENNVAKAQKYSMLTLLIGFVVSGLFISTLILFTKEVPMLYTSDETVVELAAHAMPYLSISLALDAIEGV